MAKLAFKLKLLKFMTYFVGLLPFRMEFDEESGEMKELTFSFFHRETWWYLCIFFGQLIFYKTTYHKVAGTIIQQLTVTGHDSTMLSIFQGNI